MTFLTFPVLRGQGITVHKKPKWSTVVSMHVSGRQALCIDPRSDHNTDLTVGQRAFIEAPRPRTC